MSANQKLFDAAIHLVEAMDRVADKTLPKEINEIVKEHAKLAIGSSLIPIPGVDIAASATSIWSMYIRINKKIQIPFSKNATKSIASGIFTNLLSYFAVMGVGSLLKFIPEIGTIGGIAIMGLTSYAMTLTSGYIYLKALTMLYEKGKSNIDAKDLKSAIDLILENKSEIKDFIQAAKDSYKSESKKLH